MYALKSTKYLLAIVFNKTKYTRSSFERTHGARKHDFNLAWHIPNVGCSFVPEITSR